MFDSNRLRLLLLPRYDREAASARHRFYQFLPRLNSAGFDCVRSPFFNEGYLSQRFSHKHTLLPGVLSSYGRRLRALLGARGFDVILLQVESFPYIPAAIERNLLPKNVPFVYDFDDAWFHSYGQHPNPFIRALLGQKIARLVERACGVIVGSEYIADYMRRLNENVYLIPTSIDLSRYPAAPPSRSDSPFTIGWIGSPSTTSFLKGVEKVLADFCLRHDARVVLIGAGEERLNIPNLKRLRWREEVEVQGISKFDVGIMPLLDSPFTRGKCAFKLVQYMGCWKPVIASPVGENLRVVQNGVNGFLANTPNEWMDALERLYADGTLRSAMGRAGYAKVVSKYSLDVAAPRLVEILRHAAKRTI